MKIGARGFSLIELLIAVAIFAVASAMAYVGLASITKTRERLGTEQQQFRDVQRSVALLARDLGSAAVRPIRASNGARLPALVGDAQRIEFTHRGAPGAAMQTRSILERVAWFVSQKALTRARYTVLDRAPQTTPVLRKLDSHVQQLVFRYLDRSGAWQSRWPPPQTTAPAPLPRAVEFRIRFAGIGEIRRLVALPASEPAVAASVPP